MTPSRRLCLHEQAGTPTGAAPPSRAAAGSVPAGTHLGIHTRPPCPPHPSVKRLVLRLVSRSHFPQPGGHPGVGSLGGRRQALPQLPTGLAPLWVMRIWSPFIHVGRGWGPRPACTTAFAVVSGGSAPPAVRSELLAYQRHLRAG